MTNARLLSGNVDFGLNVAFALALGGAVVVGAVIAVAVLRKRRRQPSYIVAAWDLFALLPPERWEAESLAYLDSAAELFARMATGDLGATWPRAKAGAFLFSHGLELFFKAAIAQSGEAFLWGHDLDRLHTIYRERLPDEKFVLRSKVSEFVRENAPIPFYDFLKYPERIEEINETWPASIRIDVTQWRDRLFATASEVRRVWPLILERFPRDPSRWKDSVDGESEKRAGKKRVAVDPQASSA
jgi:hypothetical protein